MHPVGSHLARAALPHTSAPPAAAAGWRPGRRRRCRWAGPAAAARPPNRPAAPAGTSRGRRRRPRHLRGAWRAGPARGTGWAEQGGGRARSLPKQKCLDHTQGGHCLSSQRPHLGGVGRQRRRGARDGRTLAHRQPLQRRLAPQPVDGQPGRPGAAGHVATAGAALSHLPLQAEPRVAQKVGVCQGTIKTVRGRHGGHYGGKGSRQARAPGDLRHCVGKRMRGG